MRTLSSEKGFTIIEMMIASMITLVIMGVAFTTFDNALALNDSVVQLADSSQNLRAGTNLLVRDLLQAGRNIPIGGISIPSGDGATMLYRPSPPNTAYPFENTTETSLKAITSGFEKGPLVDGQPTDMITIMMADPFLGELQVYPADAPTNRARLELDGSSINVGAETTWLNGSQVNAISPIKVGDLIYFNGTGTTLQTVTTVDATTMHFEPNDPFKFNQPGASAGSITQILPPDPADSPCNTVCGPAMTIRRVFMFTYYVAEEAVGVPRLMRAVNHFPAQALAGVIEDLQLRYDLVDGVINPTMVEDLPHLSDEGVTYTASQIRKVNVHVGVRSETVSAKKGDYLRTHLATVISIRNLAYVARYDTEDTN